MAESPGFDLGPSLMDEVLRALGGSGNGSGHLHMTNSPHTEKNFDWKEENSSQPGSKRGTLRDTLRKKNNHVISYLKVKLLK